MTPPITVLYLDHTAKWSGGEIALLRTLEALDRTRVNPIVVLAEEGPFRERLEAAGIEVHVLPLSEKVREVRKDSLGAAAIAGHLGTLTALFRYAVRVGRFARSCGASVLHCNSLKSDFYGALAGRVARIPVIWHVRDHIDPAYLPAPAVKLVRALARSLPAGVVTNSDSTTEKLFPAGRGKQRVWTVYDGLSAHERTTPKPALGAPFRNHPPRVGMVGRIVRWKGQHVFLEAAAKLTAEGIDARYVIVGSPLFGEQEYETELHRMAEPMGDKVVFRGFQSDIPGILRNLDILIHASISPEPFGQVVIEGMAEGLPVIASDGGGVREIMAEGNPGLVTPMGDASALAASLSALLRDPARANTLARAGWERVRSSFTAERSARGVEAVYDELLSGRRPAADVAAAPPAGKR
jgi:glycosyltransferase involved in cell wall biosynthesis